MLPGEGVLPPETLSAFEGLSVNDVFKFTGDWSDFQHRLLFENWLRRLQDAWLDRSLGPRWMPVEQGGLVCPACGGNAHTRKGYRSRAARTSKGEFPFSLAQVKCKDCGRVHRPFVRFLGLEPRRRTLGELAQKALSLALKLPYGPSAGLLKELAGSGLSHEGIRKLVARTARAAEIIPPAEVVHAQVDGTKVKAGDKACGEDVQLAISVKKGPVKNGRPTLVKKLVHLSVGGSAPLKAALRKARPKYLVHDGELNLTGCAGNVQRCLWHMGHQLGYYLWQDEAPRGEKAHIRKKLCGILYGKDYTPKGAAIAYGRLVGELKRAGLDTSAGHLVRARDEVFTSRKTPGLGFATTSPVEREMREINRRADVGARWSKKGIENVLKLLMLKRFNQLSKNMHPG